MPNANVIHESVISRRPLAPSPENLIRSAVHTGPGLKLKNAIDLIVTMAYLLQFLLPMNWFSLGRFRFIVRPGF